MLQRAVITKMPELDREKEYEKENETTKQQHLFVFGSNIDPNLMNLGGKAFKTDYNSKNIYASQ